jgi:hypothetical protein
LLRGAYQAVRSRHPIRHCPIHPHDHSEPDPKISGGLADGFVLVEAAELQLARHVAEDALEPQLSLAPGPASLRLLPCLLHPEHSHHCRDFGDHDHLQLG